MANPPPEGVRSVMRTKKWKTFEPRAFWGELRNSEDSRLQVQQLWPAFACFIVPLRRTD